MDNNIFSDDIFEEKNRRLSKSQKLNAVAGFLYGLSTLILSAFLLRNEKLQIQNYIGTSPKYTDFPTDLIGCAATTAAVSIFQMITSCLHFCEDLSYSTWNLAKLVMATVYLVCFFILNKKTFEVDYYDHYYYFLLGNSIYCTIIFIWVTLSSSCCRH